MVSLINRQWVMRGSLNVGSFVQPLDVLISMLYLCKRASPQNREANLCTLQAQTRNYQLLSRHCHCGIADRPGRQSGNTSPSHRLCQKA